MQQKLKGFLRDSLDIEGNKILNSSPWRERMINQIKGLPPIATNLNSNSTLTTTTGGDSNSLESLENDNEMKKNAKHDSDESNDVSEKREEIRQSDTRKQPRIEKKEVKVDRRDDGFRKSLKTAISDKKEHSIRERAAVSKGQSSDTIQEPVIDNISEDALEVDAAMTANPMMATSLSSTQPLAQESKIETQGEISAVMKFMKAMKDEFDISPEELVKAMSTAAQTAPQMQLNPMGQSFVTHAEFFDKLGLEGADLKRAEYLYQNMLKEMAQDSMSEYMRAQKKEADIQLLSPSDMRRSERNKGLEQMQQSFFMKDVRPAYGKLPTEAGIPKDIRENIKPSENNSSSPFFIPKEMKAVSGEKQLLNFDPNLNATNQTKNLDVSQNQAEYQKANSKFETTSTSNSSLPFMVPMQSQTSNFDMSENESEMNQEGLLNSNGTELDSGDTISESKNGFDSLITTDQSKSTLSKTANVNAIGIPLNSADTNGPRAEDAANIRNIIQNAQVLIKKGGGEMKVQMHPEGMGKVDLKVAVNEGKVDIQILADTADTKRLLEKNMSDLKASLGQHKLDVNDVRVDSMKESDRNLAQDKNQPDFNREQARQFMGQFRDEREAMRAFGDFPKIKGYGKGNPAAQITPDTGKEPEPARKNSTRLNVIA